jgi:hypothetical protein
MTITQSGTTTASVILFTGQFYDGSNNIYLFRNRHFTSILGSFLTRDSLNYPDGPNDYAGWFVPNGLDPLGRAADNDRDSVLTKCCPECKKEIELLFQLIDKAEKNTSVDDGSGPCFLLGWEFYWLQKAITWKCLSIEKKFYHIIPPILPFFQLGDLFYKGGKADAHMLHKVTLRCKDKTTVFYIDAGTHLGGNWSGNAGGNDNIFFDLPGSLVPTSDGEFPRDDEFNKLYEQYLRERYCPAFEL